MKVIATIAIALAIAASSVAANLPGFRLQFLGTPSGFLTSLAVDSKGTVYYTVQSGVIYRFANGQSTEVAKVATSLAISDAGLLGMALLDDNTAAVHYTVTLPSNHDLLRDDIVAKIDLRTGAETVLHDFVCDVVIPDRGCSMVHHGGNPVAAPDGSFFVGLGEYGGRMLAQTPGWNGGRIWRIYPDGSAVEYALGLRDPFDFVWDDRRQRLIVPDNGDEGFDELHIFTKGGNGGYPYASANQPHPPGTQPPIYVWTPTISPVGTIAPSGANDQLRSGIVITGYVSKGVHYIPDIDWEPLGEIIVVDATPENAEWIDIAEAPDGTFYLGSGFAIYKMITPRRGDCNGDGVINSADISALTKELADGPEMRIDAQDGTYRGSWGCDVNGDDRIDSSDPAALAQLMPRRRAVRVGR